MGNSTSHQQESQIRGLLKLQGIKISQKEAVSFWEEVLHLAPWMNSSNPYDPEVWTRVAYLPQTREVQGGTAPRSFLPIIAAIQECEAQPEKEIKDEPKPLTPNNDSEEESPEISLWQTSLPLKEPLNTLDRK